MPACKKEYEYKCLPCHKGTKTREPVMHTAQQAQPKLNLKFIVTLIFYKSCSYLFFSRF